MPAGFPPLKPEPFWRKPLPFLPRPFLPFKVLGWARRAWARRGEGVGAGTGAATVGVGAGTGAATVGVGDAGPAAGPALEECTTGLGTAITFAGGEDTTSSAGGGGAPLFLAAAFAAFAFGGFFLPTTLLLVPEPFACHEVLMTVILDRALSERVLCVPPYGEAVLGPSFTSYVTSGGDPPGTSEGPGNILDYFWPRATREEEDCHTHPLHDSVLVE